MQREGDIGPQFPYNQYLRQIPVQDAIKMTDTTEEEQKRPRPDELESNEVFDEDLTRLNQGSDEFRRRSKRKKAFRHMSFRRSDNIKRDEKYT